MNLKRNQDGYLVIDEKSVEPKFVQSDKRVWLFFENDGKRYFFKGENFVTNADYEILAGYIADAVGIDAVKYFPAVFVDKGGNKIRGVACEDYTKGGQNLKLNGQALVSYCQAQGNTIENQIEGLENFLIDAQAKFKGKIIYNKRKIQNSLFKMLIFDTFTLNTDRAPRNIEYLLKKVDQNVWEVSLAPIYDNSQIFGSESFEKRISIVNSIDNDAPLPQKVLKNTKLLFGTEDCTDFESVAKIISKQAMFNPYLKIVTENFKKLDLDELYNQITKENPGYKITGDTIKIAKKVLDGTIKENALFKRKRFNFEF